MKSSRIIHWGIIGAGDVCEKKSAPAMYKLPGSRVKSVMRRNLEKAEDYARRHNIPFYYNDAEAIFSDPEIDIVYIATPPSSHAELAFRAARAGKAVYVEKPMALSFGECIRMNEAFRLAGLPLFVAYYRRTLPNFVKIRKLITEGAIGEVRTVNIMMNKEPVTNNVAMLKYNWRVIPEISGGGYFYDLASHQFDLLDFFFGPIKEAQGIAVNQAGMYPAEDAVNGYFRFENGIVGSGSWCFTSGKSSCIDRTTITGSKGYIQFATFGDSSVHLHTDDHGKEILKFTLPEHIQQDLIQTILNELNGIGKCPSDGISAARTNKVLEWINKAVI